MNKEEILKKLKNVKKRPSLPIWKQFNIVFYHVKNEMFKKYSYDQVYFGVASILLISVAILIFPFDGGNYKRFYMQFISLFGCLIAGYAIFVEYQLSVPKQFRKFEPMCDIEGYSCSEVLNSEQSRLLSFWNIIDKNSSFDVTLGQLGFVLFLFYFVLVTSSSSSKNGRNLLKFVSILSVLFSIYLMKIMYFDLKHLCLVCTLTHLLNFILFILIQTDSKVKKKNKTKVD